MIASHAQLQQRYRPTLHETHTTENEMLGCLEIREVRAMTVRETDTHTQRERQTRCEHERDTKQQRPRSLSSADPLFLNRECIKYESIVLRIVYSVPVTITMVVSAIDRERETQLNT